MSQNCWIIIYDDKCAFCRRQIDRIKNCDTQDLFEYLPNDTPDILKRFPQLEAKDLNASIWLIAPDGTLYAAAEAVYQIVLRLPKYNWLALFYRLPFFHSAARWTYRWIAKHRK